MESKEKLLDIKCSIDKEGTVTCDITKEDFSNLQNQNIKPQQVVFEID